MPTGCEIEDLIPSDLSGMIISGRFHHQTQGLPRHADHDRERHLIDAFFVRCPIIAMDGIAHLNVRREGVVLRAVGLSQFADERRDQGVGVGKSVRRLKVFETRRLPRFVLSQCWQSMGDEIRQASCQFRHHLCPALCQVLNLRRQLHNHQPSHPSLAIPAIVQRTFLVAVDRFVAPRFRKDVNCIAMESLSCVLCSEESAYRSVGA